MGEEMGLGQAFHYHMNSSSGDLGNEADDDDDDDDDEVADDEEEGGDQLGDDSSMNQRYVPPNNLDSIKSQPETLELIKQSDEHGGSDDDKKDKLDNDASPQVEQNAVDNNV